jgi:hypothetical protein
MNTTRADGVTGAAREGAGPLSFACHPAKRRLRYRVSVGGNA